MMSISTPTKISRPGWVRLSGSLLVTSVAATLVISMAVPLTAGAAAPRTPSGPSRLYVGTTLRPGARAESSSGVFRVDVFTGGRIEILKNGRVAWRSGAVTEIARALLPANSTRRAANHVSHGSEATTPSYLKIDNDGDVALVTKSGVPMWHGGLRARVSGLSEAPYTAGAFYGDTNPSVTCYTCAASDVTGSAPPSNTLDSGSNVDVMTGDFSTSNTLFDAPAIGGDLSLSLGYDAQLAQSDLANSTSGLAFGEGWSSNFSSSVTTSGQSVIVNQGNGSQVTFNESSNSGASTSCQLSGDPTKFSGDYPFTAKYTISGSTYNFCALGSVQGQLSETPGTGFTFQVSGGDSIQNYAWNGQLEGVTSNAALSVSGGSPAQGLEYYSVSAGTTSEGGVTLSNACPGTATYGCTIVDAHDGRDIVEVLNSVSEVTEVIDPSGSTYSLTYSSSSRPNNLTSVTEPSPTGTGTSTWTYEYSASSSPYSSNMVEIYDPDATSPSGVVAGALHSTTITYTSSTGSQPGMVASLEDGMPTNPATTSYSYTSACSTGQCTGSGDTQTTTILYPAECPNSTTTCTATSWPTTVAADIPKEVDQYTSGLETSTQLGSQSNPSEVETWLYNWNLGNGAANTSEQITYPNTLQGSSPNLQSETIITDPAGNIISTTDPLGDVATSSFNESTSLNIPELAWSYPGPSSNPSSSPPSGSSRYTYDSFGQAVTAIDPLGNITYYGYYANYSLLCYEVSPALAQRLGWTSSTAPPSCTSSYTTYDSGAVGAPTGATTYNYDEQGDVAGQTIDAGDTGASADPQTTTASYNLMGDILWQIPPAGQSGSQSSSNSYATSYAYVSHTSVPSYRYQPGSITTQYAYDAAGNLASSGNNSVTPSVFTTTLYDGDNRPCYQLLASGSFGASCVASSTRGSTSWTYEPGTTNVFQTADSKGNVTSNYYADLAYPNSPTEVQDAGITAVQYSAYNDYGEACVYGDAAPTPGSTQCSTTPSGDSAATYDALGNKLTITDPSGNTTTNSYEDASYPTLVTRSVNSMGATTKFVFDAAGDLVTTVNPDGTGVTENYNPNGEVCNKMPSLVQFSCGQGPSAAGVTQYGYNNADERTSMSDNTGNPATPTAWSQTTTYTYTQGQLTSTTDGDGKTLNYAYNHDGEVSCTAYPVSTSTNCNSPASATNTIVTRSYDALGRVSSVADWLANTTGYTYSNSSTPNAPSTIAYPSLTGVTANYGYDNNGELTSLSAGSAISDSWTYDNDQRVATTDINGSTSASTAYNQNNQITSATNLGSSTSNDTYTVAANGEITQDVPPSSSTTSFAYNVGDELCWSVNVSSTNSCSSPPSASVETNYTYSANGERASAATTTGSGTTTTDYAWNPYGELCDASTAATNCGSTPANGTSYTYNGDGLRTTTSTASTAAGTISAVGTLQQGSGTPGRTTLSVNPQNVGDALVLMASINSSSITIASVSGGGATWQKSTSTFDGEDIEMWLGTVTTTGSSTITVTYSGTIGSTGVELDAQEYTNGTGASTVWSDDVVGNSHNDTSSTTVAYPMLSPTHSGEAYVGYAHVPISGAAGSTSGFTYVVTASGNKVVAFNPNVSSVSSPTASQSPTGTSVSVGALVIASATPTTLTTDSTWDTVSGGSLPLNINDAATSSLTPGSTTNVSYIYGDLLFGGTAPIEQITTTASGSTAVFLVANQTGVQGVFSSSGATDELAVYSPYGKQTIKSGSDVTPFGFQGSYTDSTGLIYLIDRYYDPSTDQFMSVDPLFDATNQPYVFLGDDPLNSTDPLGDVAGSGRWVACLVLAATINCLSLFRANEPGGGPGPGEISAKTFDDTKVKNPKLAKRHEPGKSSFWGDVGGVFLAPSRALHWVVSRIPAPPQLRFPHVGPFPLPIPLPVFAAG